MTTSTVPELAGDALAASKSRSSHIQIIAAAGAGKTETISQRVAKLVAGGVEPAQIVAFTFTVKAAAELKERIRERVRKFAGQGAADKIGNMYVGTIHGFCLQMLQQNVEKYETYDMIDENQLAAFAIRWGAKLDLKRFAIPDKKGNRGLYAGMGRFLQSIEVIENELIPLDSLPEELRDFKDATSLLYELLDQHRLLTFGMQISKAVEVLSDEASRRKILSGISHLIVDEYQDVNVAQERLIQLLAKPIGNADLVVVGDDDQAIYQWRGSTVANIAGFSGRYPNVETYKLLENRRSRPKIVEMASAFANTIEGRLEKTMGAVREHNGPAVDIADLIADEITEAEDIALTIKRLVEKGFNYKDIAILVRGRTSYPAILSALEAQSIPVASGDRVGLLEQQDAQFLARVFAYLSESGWSPKRGQPFEDVLLKDLVGEAASLFGADPNRVEAFLVKAKAKVGNDSRTLSLVDFVYDFIAILGVQEWSPEDRLLVGRLGTIAKFVGFIGDYEGIQKHARLTGDGTQTGAGNDGVWYFKSLSILLKQYAEGNYKDFGGEDDNTLDAIDLMTVHAAKGLEWPIVFVPAVTGRRFPSSNSGKVKDWLIPRDLFDASRYEGSKNDERRLFYVALTRAREWISISAHSKVGNGGAGRSPFMDSLLLKFNEMADPNEWTDKNVVDEGGVLQISFSDLANYLECGWSYWLRNRIGFPAAIVEELGYGKAVHHLMRIIAEESTRRGAPLGPRDVDRILATDFFLPFANSALAENLKNSARKLIQKYMREYAEDTTKTWQTERPFELEVAGAVISGRADVILDMHNGVVDNLAIVDYKTSVGEQSFDLQLQVYAEAGSREGLTVSAAYIHDMQDASRQPVPIDIGKRKEAIKQVEEAVSGIKARKFDPNPSIHVCSRCDVRAICKAAAKA